MAKVTSKFQVTVPKKIADRYRISPGDDIEWVAAGEVIRVIPPASQVAPEDRESQLRLFDQATERHRKRPSPRPAARPKARPKAQPRNRGWRREDLYRRDGSH
jgi:AbrB family looped-hinge helix DNA binding protein